MVQKTLIQLAIIMVLSFLAIVIAGVLGAIIYNYTQGDRDNKQTALYVVELLEDKIDVQYK